MSVFLSSPFNLTPMTLIVGIVEAKNSVGYSIPSNENAGPAYAQSSPSTPSVATTSNSDTNIQIDWIYPTDNGSAITSYEI